jgi:ribosomal protein S18 acetylase RimI-like enzyme
MNVRRLTPADADEYRALRLRAFREHPEAFTSSYEEEVLKPVSSSEQRLAADSAGRFWGAFVDGTLAGMVGLDREPRIKNRHKAVVIGMYVAPEYARRGIGRALLDALLADAYASQLELLVLTVTHGNDGAQGLYLDVGFKSFGIEPGAIKVQNQNFDKNHMYLTLTQAFTTS